jgi:hypothetical protein
MEYFQWISFLFLALVSSFFTYNLAIELGTSPLEKVALIGGSLAIEALKLYCLVAANMVREHKGKMMRMVGLYGAYGFVALYSLLASFGYAISTVDQVGARVGVVSKVDDINLERKNQQLYEESISTTQKAIADKRSAIASLDDDKITRKIELQKLIVADQQSIQDYMSKRMESQTRINTLQTQDKTNLSTQKRTMYEVIGDTLAMSPRWVAFWVLAIFAISIEIGIFVTSPHSHPQEPKPAPEPVPTQPMTKEPDPEPTVEPVQEAETPIEPLPYVDPGNNARSSLRAEMGGKRKILVD